MPLENLLLSILREPTPDDLWRLHPHLLALDSPDAEPARALAGQFYSYLSSVRSKLTAKQYSVLSAVLAAGSVGVIAAQDVIEEIAADRHQMIGDLLAGGLAAILETMSAFQHVKAWETEFGSVHEEAIWHLYAELWRISVEAQPDLTMEQRQALLDRLFAAARDPKQTGGARMVLIIRLFQVLLAIRLAPLLRAAEPEPQT
jgi:hypothetical protein